LCADYAGFVDHEQVGGMGAAGEVAGKIGQADADEDNIAVSQEAGGVDGEEF
jgi:hypothetical protein